MRKTLLILIIASNINAIHSAFDLPDLFTEFRIQLFNRRNQHPNTTEEKNSNPWAISKQERIIACKIKAYRLIQEANEEFELFEQRKKESKLLKKYLYKKEKKRNKKN